MDLTIFMPPPPLPERMMPPRIKTPINPDDLANFKTQVSLKLGQQIASIQTQVTELTNEAETTLRRDIPMYTKDTPSSTILHTLAPQKRVLEEQMKKLLLEGVMAIAETTLEMTKPVERKHRFHRPRNLQRKYIRAAKMARWLRKAAFTFDDAVESRDRANATKGIDALLVQHSDFDSNRMPFPPACPVLSEGHISQTWLAWREEVKKEAVIARATRKMIRIDEAKHLKAKYRTFIQRLFAKKQKAANKIIKGSSTNNKITALRDTEGNVHSDPEKVSKIVEDYFQELAKPRVDLNIGERTPDCDTLSCPWEQKIDPFKLQTRVHTESSEHSQPCILALLKDECRFLNRLRKLARNKAPGKDGVQNEILKNLPDDLLDSIHKLFVLRYLLGQTPADCKTSQTVLLYKKGSPLDIKNYRPIALANTMTKLYTGLLTDCMTDFAENNDILSSSQEGFRRGKGTARQLLMMQNVLSDAQLFGEDIYLMYVDFSSACNTIDHDKLLLIMRGLGFPEDCIEAVKDLYTDAETEFILPAGNTNPIKIERGTIQGDSLSPLLFLIFVEPLLRWLHSGGRGHRLSCLKDENVEISSLAYADDLCAMTNSHRDLAIQAQKIEIFGEWGGLKVNNSKCAVTGMLYGLCNKESAGGSLNHKLIERLQKRLELVQIETRPLPFKRPDMPYTYLGVEITANLEGKYQVNKVKEVTLDKAAQVLASAISPKQILQYIQSSIRPMIAYSLSLGIYTAYDIQILDSILARIAKKAMGLPISTPTAMTLKERKNAGVGVTSLMVDYLQVNAACMTNAFNDPGPLGKSIKALLRAEEACMGRVSTLEVGLQDKKYLKFIRHFYVTNRLSLLRSAKVELQTPEYTNLLTTNTNANRLMNFARYKQNDIPGKVYIPLMEIGILSINECICIERKAECFVGSSQLHSKCQGRIRPRHRIALNRLTLLLNGQVSAQDALNYNSPSDLPWEQRKVPLELALDQEIQPTKEQKLMWDWVNQTVPARRPELETGGLHEEQIRRGAYEVTITRSRKRKRTCETQLDYQEREMQNDDLMETFEAYLAKDKSKKQRTGDQTRSSEAQATQVEHGSETQSEEDDSDTQSEENDSESEFEEEILTDVLQIVDEALNEINYRVGSKRCPPKGITDLKDFVRWIVLKSTNDKHIRSLYSHQERLLDILHRESVAGKDGCMVQWGDTIILERHLKFYNKINDHAKSTRALKPTENSNLKNRSQWIVVSWQTAHEPLDVIEKAPMARCSSREWKKG